MFRLTGTLFAKGLLSSNHFRQIIKIAPKEINFDDVWRRKILDDLILSWFSNSRSTDSMKRGTANENSIMKALINLDFVICFFEVGMFAYMSAIWITVSPDEVGIIDISKLYFEKDIDNCYPCTKIHLDKEEYVSCEFTLIYLTN